MKTQFRNPMDGMTGINASEIPDGFTADQSGGGDKAAERNAQVQGILEQIMEASAYERLQRIKIVKKEKAAAIENQLVQMATSGKLPGKISETRLIQMLEGGGDAQQTKVKIQRRNYGLDSDDSDDNDDDLM
ncbi:hypothetical protein TrRE_jg1264 [Triparma retinervis]|uniref:Programmed cell death protein 5 n=1 Tax=Triparma retinervis TaxID=2557542 RepID=A0A9W6ZMG7_9STRA|nr:hypothetical protein TrRE_jg1264 [Triparma retinervis]